MILANESDRGKLDVDLMRRRQREMHIIDEVMMANEIARGMTEGDNTPNCSNTPNNLVRQLPRSCSRMKSLGA